MKKQPLLMVMIVIGIFIVGLAVYACWSLHRYDGVDGAECMRMRTTTDQACGV